MLTSTVNDNVSSVLLQQKNKLTIYAMLQGRYHTNS